MLGGPRSAIVRIFSHSDSTIRMATKLLVVDEHPVIAAGVAAVVEGTDIKVVGSAAASDAAVRLARKHRPNVVLLDVRIAEQDGFETLEKLKNSSPKAAVVMFATVDNPAHVADAIARGAHDVLGKEVPSEELVRAIKRAADGIPPPNATELRRLAGSMANRKERSGSAANLTPRESEVLRQIALGLSNREISKTLHISVETVKEHVQNLLRKIAVADRTQAAVWAIRNGAG